MTAPPRSPRTIERVRRAPEILAQVRTDIASLNERLPHARETLERLALRYSESALRQVAEGADEAEQLLTFAAHSADVSARRREAGRREEANLALETSTEAVRRAAAIIDGVEDFEIEALRAESTLADVIADSRGDLVAARQAPQVPAVTQAVTALERALAALPASRRQGRPVRRAVPAARSQQRLWMPRSRWPASAPRAPSRRSPTCATRSMTPTARSRSPAT